MQHNHKFLQYYVREKYAVVSYAIFEGFNIRHEGAWVPAARGKMYSGRGFTHIATGLQYGTLEVMREIIKGTEPYIFIEAGYLLAKPHLTSLDTWRLRVVPNSYQQSWISHNQDTERLFNLCMRGLEIRERRLSKKQDYILVIPPSSRAVIELFGIYNWTLETINEIKKHTKRNILIREKSSKEPLSAHLAGAHCVVGYTSNVSTDAVLAGVPAFCDSKAAAYPVATPITRLAEIEDPYFPEEDKRIAWLASLANNQFSVKEIKAGMARAKVMEEMECRKRILTASSVTGQQQ